jgi:hypothetical protein
MLAGSIEKKSDLLPSKYILELQKGETKFALKISVILGDEVLVSQKIFGQYETSCFDTL